MVSTKMRENAKSVTDELQPGSELMRGQYKITRYLNSGGFGITYLAKDSLDRSVVIKECFPRSFCYRNSDMSVQARSEAQNGDLRSIVRLFANEARSLAKLKHPYIVGVHQTFEEHNTAYMALDFVKGHDLLAVIERKVMLLRPDQVRAILEKVLDAIGSVHRQGLLHRDISPDNIIVTNELNPVLIDFGAAREQATKASRALSALRVVKDGYSPQEFYIAGSEQGPFSDLYSLAASFYHVISGELPPDSQLRISAHVAGDPDPYVPLARKTDDYDESFCEAIDKAMSILPADRVQSADEWLALMSKPVPMSRRMSRTRSSRRSSRLTTPDSKGAAAKRKSGLRVLALSSAGIAAAVTAGVIVAPIMQPIGDGGRVEPIQVASAGAAPEIAEATTPVADASTAPDESPISASSGGVPMNSEGALVASSATLLGDFSRSHADGQVTMTAELIMPFHLDDTNTITDISDGAPAWLETGVQLTNLNGTPILPGESFSAALRSAAVSNDGRSVMLDLALENGEADARTLGQMAAPILFETRFRENYAFATSFQGDQWVTRVTYVGSETSGLREGDVIVGPVSSDERLTSGEALAQVISRAVESGGEAVEFAVSRDGLMWIEAIDLRPETR